MWARQVQEVITREGEETLMERKAFRWAKWGGTVGKLREGLAWEPLRPLSS